MRTSEEATCPVERMTKRDFLKLDQRIEAFFAEMFSKADPKKLDKEIQYLREKENCARSSGTQYELETNELTKTIKNFETLKRVWMLLHTVLAEWEEVQANKDKTKAKSHAKVLIKDQIPFLEARGSQLKPWTDYLQWWAGKFESYAKTSTELTTLRNTKTAVSSDKDFERTHNTERQETFKTQEITYSQALAMAQKPASQILSDTIYKVARAQTPRVRHEYEGDGKEYVFLHGSASSDKSLINAGMRGGDFAYGILQNGTILQFFDAGLGQGAAGPYAMIDGDPMASLKGIAIELSLPEDRQVRHEVEDPNTVQKLATKRLLAKLQEQYGITNGNITLSSIAVMENNGRLLNNVHGDTQTWTKKPQMLAAMGIDVKALKQQKRVPEFKTRAEKETFLQQVEARIELAQTQKENYPIVRNSAQKAERYWSKVKKAYQAQA